VHPSIYRSALISTDQRYRYQLARSWSQDFGSYALWLGLNPSTADGEQDDPTVDNMCRRTQLWGAPPEGGKPFVGIFLGNLYAWRATDPLQLLYKDDPVGPENDTHLRYMISRSDMVICAWGNGPFNIRQQPMHMNRCREVLQLVSEYGKTAYMLARTGSKHPRHPLYWPADAQPQVFDGYDDQPHKGKEDGDKGRGTRTTEEAPQ
jgi:hypothetical protein